MANRIKSISKYSGTAWGTETPIGADAANVDLATSYTTVTESTATSGATAEAAIGKIHTDTTNLKKAGHGNGTVTNYDSASSETSKVLTTDCVVAASDDTATAWSKFNRFRRRVSNKFTDYFKIANLVTSSTGVTTTGADTTVYTTKAINNYLANVVGYTSSTAPEVGSIATQLSTLNDYALYNVEIVASVDEHIAEWIVYHWKFKHPNTAITNDHFVLVQTAWSSPQFAGYLLNGWYYRTLGAFHWPYVFVGTPNGYFNLSYWGTGLFWGSMRATSTQTFHLEVLTNSASAAAGNGQIFAFGYI